MNNYSVQIDRLKQAIDQAEAIVIGAGSGLSTSAGLAYTGQRFQQHFSEFIAKYHFTDMYSATFYPYDSLEEYWAYMSRHIYLNRYTDFAGKPYLDLRNIMERKNYFVLTTNVDHQFQQAGFDPHRLFYTQGDYGLWQCAVPCHDQTYDNEEAVMSMLKEQKDLRIPAALVPYCPKCGKPMTMNLRSDHTFVQDEEWYAAANRYSDFLHQYQDRKILYLELGVGGNTPAIIKYPFWEMTAQNPKAIYACLNLEDASCPPGIEDQSICMQEDIGQVIQALFN